MSNAPGVGTSVNVKSPPEVWGRPGWGWGLKLTGALEGSGYARLRTWWVVNCAIYPRIYQTRAIG